MSDGAYGSYGSIDVSDIDIGAIYLADVDAATTVEEVVVYAPKQTSSGDHTYVYAVPVQTITAVNISNIAADCTITPVSNTTVTVNGVTYHQSTTTTTVKYGGVTETDTTITTTASNGASSTEYLSTYSTSLGNLTTDTAIINYPNGGQAVAGPAVALRHSSQGRAGAVVSQQRRAELQRHLVADRLRRARVEGLRGPRVPIGARRGALGPAQVAPRQRGFDAPTPQSATAHPRFHGHPHPGGCGGVAGHVDRLQPLESPAAPPVEIAIHQGEERLPVMSDGRAVRSRRRQRRRRDGSAKRQRQASQAKSPSEFTVHGGRPRSVAEQADLSTLAPGWFEQPPARPAFPPRHADRPRARLLVGCRARLRRGVEMKPIAVVQGAASPTVQALLRQFISRLEPQVRVSGVIEDPTGDDGGSCAAGDLRCLSDDRRFSLMQDLGVGAAACRLDSAGIVSACAAAQQAIAAGCDLVVLSKFGKLEAQRSGLAPAFASAIEAGLPVLTSVAPRLAEPWDRFAAPLYVVLPPDLAAIEAWWQAVNARAGAAMVTPG